MNKVHVGKIKTLVSYDDTKFILKQLCQFVWCVCESGKNCIIKRLNFVIIIIHGVRILV